MGKGLTAALCLLVLAAAPARAEEAIRLQGQWQVTIPVDPAFSGVLLIDAERRATWDSAWDPKRRPDAPEGRATSRGYAQISGSAIDIVLTNGSRVERVHCAIQSSDLLHCRTALWDGRTSSLCVLTRVGPGPKNLMLARQ